MAEKEIDFLSQIVSPEQLSKVREPAAGAPKARNPVPSDQIDYSGIRDELGDVRVVNSGTSARGTAGPDGPATPAGSLPTLDYNATRPELAGKSFLEILRERNSRTLTQLRDDYIEECEQYKQGRIAHFPSWAPQAAIDYSECLKREGPSAGNPPPIEMASPRV